MTRTFQPSCRREAYRFMDSFCNHCTRERWPCAILHRAMTLDSTDPDYPAEWIVDEEAGPVCTAYTTPGASHPAVFRASELLRGAAAVASGAHEDAEVAL